MGKLAVLFAGQGAQAVGMGKDFADRFAAARRVYQCADDLLAMPLSRYCFEGPAETLNRTDISQPAILVTSVAIWEALREAGVSRHWRPSAMAGLSLGEYTALHAAGWLEFEDAIRVVAERGRLMQRAAESVAGGMVSIMGVDEQAVDELCKRAAGGATLVPANFNCPGQIVISGDQKACERAIAAAESFGARAIPLKVAGAFHSPLMKSAVAGLKNTLADVTVNSGTIAVVSNVSADYHADPNRVRGLLTEQVAKPIRWQASIERLIADGFNRFMEIGPGRVLTGLMRKISRDVEIVNYSTVAGLGDIASDRITPSKGRKALSSIQANKGR